VSLDVFSTSRLVAERLSEKHWDDLRRMDQDEPFMQHLGGVRDEAATRSYMARNLAHWAQYGFGLWVLRNRSTGAISGRAVLRHLLIEGVDEVEAGYGFLPEFWGRGLASEILQACLGFGRNQLRLVSVVGITTPTNSGSQQVLRKAGFAHEGNIVHEGVHCMLFRSGYSSSSGLTNRGGATWNVSAE
jgi:RimJ/RimL family protein N-acetyltransferase